MALHLTLIPAEETEVVNMGHAEDDWMESVMEVMLGSVKPPGVVLGCMLGLLNMVLLMTVPGCPQLHTLHLKTSQSILP